tara:strand:+ start:119 stop:343 length:225 start_codon:yes stop_codon:yes gene_type:complete
MDSQITIISDDQHYVFSPEQKEALEWSIEMTLESIYEYHQKHHRESGPARGHPAPEVVKKLKVLAQLQQDISNF